VKIVKYSEYFVFIKKPLVARDDILALI
jgi:hypothetical protein